MLVLFTLLLGASTVAVGILTMPAVSRLLGASDAMMPDYILYGRIVTGFIFLHAAKRVPGFIAAESPAWAFSSPWPPASPTWCWTHSSSPFSTGAWPAAIATGLSQCRRRTAPDLLPASQHQPAAPALRRLRLRPILQSCGNGSSELMSNISSSLVVLYNFQLMRLIGEDRRLRLRRSDVPSSSSS